MSRMAANPALATTYDGHSPDFWERVLPLVDYVEVTPDLLVDTSDSGVSLDSAAVARLKELGQRMNLIAHGVGMSIGSHDGISPRYLRLLDLLLGEVEVAWHSEHLAYSEVDGEFLGTMATLPRTRQVLDMVCRRVDELQERYHVPFLLENVARILPDPPGELSEAEFLNRVVAQTGCGILLDIYNLECDAHNLGLDPKRFLSEIDMMKVREVHIAGGINYRGFQMDVHSQITRESTLALAREALALAQGNIQVVTYELLPEAVSTLGEDVIESELVRISDILRR